MSTSDPSPELLSHDAIVQHCSNVIHSFFDMINSRQFSPSHPFWTSNIAPNYTYAGLHGDFAAYDTVDLAAHLGNFEGLTRDVFPEFRLEVVGTWTQIAEEKRDVRSYMNYVQVNCPKGIVKPSAAEVGWVWDEGRLKILEVRTMGGGGG